MKPDSDHNLKAERPHDPGIVDDATNHVRCALCYGSISVSCTSIRPVAEGHSHWSGSGCVRGDLVF
eukprot:4012481-Pyramimonas_sp.AAC.1